MPSRGVTGVIVAAVGALAVAGVFAMPGPTPAPKSNSDVGSATQVGPGGVRPPSEPATDPTASVSEPATSAALHMLDSVELRPLSADWAWQTIGTTAGEGSTPGASCAATSLAELGAHDVARRDFTGFNVGARANAGQVIGSFDNAAGAQQAYVAMQSWRQTCPARMQRQGYDSASVSIFVPAYTNADYAGWWAGEFSQAGNGSDDVWLALTGITASGATISVVWLETSAPADGLDDTSSVHDLDPAGGVGVAQSAIGAALAQISQSVRRTSR